MFLPLLELSRSTPLCTGCVAKITGKEGLHFTGKARVYDSEEDMLASLARGELKKAS